MEKSSVESKLRKIIREELDYYFDRLESRLNESKSSVFSKESSNTTYDRPVAKLKESNEDIEKINELAKRF